MANDFWDTVRAIHGCPRTERVVQTYVEPGTLVQDPRTQHQTVAPPQSTTSNPGVTSFPGFPSRLVQGVIATGAALGVVIGAALNTNIFVTAFAGGAGAGLGGVVIAANKKNPKEEAKKMLLAAGDRYAQLGDVEKLTTVKQILGDLEEK